MSSGVYIIGTSLEYMVSSNYNTDAACDSTQWPSSRSAVAWPIEFEVRPEMGDLWRILSLDAERYATEEPVVGIVKSREKLCDKNWTNYSAPGSLIISEKS